MLKDTLARVRDHKNNVYYFPFVTNFGEVLSAFITEHPELQLVAMAVDVCGGASGYFVVFKEKGL